MHGCHCCGLPVCFPILGHSISVDIGPWAISDAPTMFSLCLVLPDDVEALDSFEWLEAYQRNSWLLYSFLLWLLRWEHWGTKKLFPKPLPNEKQIDWQDYCGLNSHMSMGEEAHTFDCLWKETQVFIFIVEFHCIYPSTTGCYLVTVGYVLA